MIPLSHRIRLQKLTECLTEPDRYGGLDARDYVMAGTNVRSELLPNCPCCGASTSIQQTHTNLMGHIYLSLNPDKIKITYHLYCGACKNETTYDRLRDK